MIHWGLVGVGAIANKRVAPALVAAQGSSLQAVCDIAEGSARDLAQRFDVPSTYTDFGKLLADDRVDAVYVATPIWLHAEQAVQALAAGKHVLVEKPMALTAAEAGAMVDAARSAGKTLATAYYRRFFPKVARAREIIDAGLVGRVVMVTSVYHTWYDPSPGAPGSWRTQHATAGGGVLWDMGSHRFDLLIGLLGMPDQVWATKSTLAHEYEVEDTATVYLRFHGGIQCASTWGWNSQAWVDHLAIIGTSGKIVMEPVDSPNLTLFVGKGRTQERTDEQIALPENVHLPMIQDFVDAVSEGRPPVERGEEGMKVNLILDAIDRSAASGCLVTL